MTIIIVDGNKIRTMYKYGPLPSIADVTKAVNVLNGYIECQTQEQIDAHNNQFFGGIPFEPTIKAPESYSDEFEIFWEAYPKKAGKAKAYERYKQALKKGVSHEQIMMGLKKYNDHILMNGTEEQFIKHAEGWLNAKRWEDDLGTVESWTTADWIGEYNALGGQAFIDKYGYDKSAEVRRFIALKTSF